MKKIILLISGFLLAAGCFSQPTISQLMNLDIGDEYTMKEGGYEISTAMITEGPNQVWDFSVLPPDNNPAKGICIDPASTPFSDSTEVKNSNVAIKAIDDGNDTTHIYQFLRVSPDQCESMALGAYNRIIQQNVSYTKWLDPAISIKLPFSYGDSYTDRHVLWINHLPDNTIVLKDTSNTLYQAVGYGTLKTPAGTFQNTLLVKETVDWVWWNNYSNNIYKTQGTDLNYHWFVPGIKIPVMSVNLADETGGIVNYVSETQFQTGGIDNPDDSGSENDNGNGDGEEPFNSSGIWLNALTSGSDFFSKSIGSLSWTAGEAVIETLKMNPFLTQGFNQPYDVLVSAKEIKDLKLKIYPNPFTSEITVDFGNFEKEVEAALYNTTGQIIKSFKLSQPVNRLYLNECKAGMYYLRLIDAENPKTFKIIKK